ncbi:MAG: GNAT family N-acetyltransferase [Planctomycetaceae bacterium]
MNLDWREASDTDVGLLAEWNHQLIHDEGHRNAMTVDQLAGRMKKWLAGDYRAIIFFIDAPVAYTLFKEDATTIHLRQFFIRRDRRRTGVGRSAIDILRREIWPSSVRLTVDVLCHNGGGIAFWRNVGYRDYCLTLEIEPIRSRTPETRC